jgi:hypothetical protein
MSASRRTVALIVTVCALLLVTVAAILALVLPAFSV